MQSLLENNSIFYRLYLLKTKREKLVDKTTAVCYNMPVDKTTSVNE